MSHTTCGKEHLFIHNGDFSGDVIIARSKDGVELAEVPFADLKMLVASWVRDKRIYHLECQAEDDEILGVPKEVS